MKIDAQEFFNIGQSLPALTSKALDQTALAIWQIDFHILGPVLTASNGLTLYRCPTQVLV